MEGRITERKDQIVEDGKKDGTDPLYHLHFRILCVHGHLKARLFLWTVL